MRVLLLVALQALVLLWLHHAATLHNVRTLRRRLRGRVHRCRDGVWMDDLGGFFVCRWCVLRAIGVH